MRSFKLSCYNARSYVVITGELLPSATKSLRFIERISIRHASTNLLEYKSNENTGETTAATRKVIKPLNNNFFRPFVWCRQPQREHIAALVRSDEFIDPKSKYLYFHPPPDSNYSPAPAQHQRKHSFVKWMIYKREFYIYNINHGVSCELGVSM